MEVRSVEAIVKALNEAGVQYLIVGGLAVNAHGFLRHTNDVDLVIALEPANITAGLRALHGAGYNMKIPVTPEQFADPATREKWRSEKNMLVLQLWSDAHRATPVDVFITEPFPFIEEQSRAPQFEVAPGLWAPFVSKETLLKMKQAAGRPQDIEDVRRLNRL
jgi:hypothetical protein